MHNFQFFLYIQTCSYKFCDNKIKLPLTMLKIEQIFFTLKNEVYLEINTLYELVVNTICLKFEAY
jgi:hypothetical protein